MVPVSEIVYESRGKLIGGSLSKEREAKSRPSGTRVVTFIGGSDGGIRDPARKRLIRWRHTRSSEKETDGIRDSTRNCDNEYIVDGVDKLVRDLVRDSADYKRQCGLLETVRITRGSGRTVLCAARDLFGVVVRR